MKLHKGIFRLPVYFFSLITGVFFLTSCIVGGDDGVNAPANITSFTLSTNTINFTAEAPSVIPDSQKLTGTVTGDLTGILYILVDVSGTAVSSASDVVFDLSAQTGTVTIYPGSAERLGVGSHSSTITVRACINDATCATGELSGSPRIVDVSYQVKSSVHAESVMPQVAKANVSGDVVIRGFDFTDNITKVSFTNTDATSVSVISDTEIHATYPALNAGTYSVQLGNDSGVMAFSGDLVVIESPAFVAGTLQYPSAAPRQILKTIYDAKNEALFVAASDFNGSNFTTSRQTNRILRYQFLNGELVSEDSSVIPLLQGMSLSPDGGQLIAITDTQVLHLNPDTLVQTNSTTIDSSWPASQYFKDIIVTNDGNALITTGYIGSGSTSSYLYPISEPGLYKTNHSCAYYGSPGVSANGAYAVFIQGGLSPVPPLCDYMSSFGTFTEIPTDFIKINQKQCTNSSMGLCIHPVIDKTGSRIAITDNSSSVSVYDNLSMLGKLPITSEAVVFNEDASRLYAYDSTSDVLRTYDLSSVVSGHFQEIGSGTTLAGSPGTGVLKIILSADGSTLFIVGNSQIIIQPVP